LSLTSGTRLGVYQINAQIGEGGMGQVYRATDTKLKRQVAIKILPPSLAADHDRLARFQREAEVLASLNHPHIAAIYGLEESAGITALVMELVEGDDLSQRIARGAISIEEALPIAKQIAEALEAAHEQGIIHRDLKPANIRIRPDGRAKVLDFGLAKALSAEMASASVDNSPTLTAHATKMGMIIGTAAYMSPEQARGKPVDKRADIWAFGVVFYEMLTGRRAFDGEDVSSILAAVLQSEPRWDGVPPNLRRVLESCLEKDPRNRLRDIGDVWRLVDDAPTPAASSLRPTRMGWMVAAALAGVAAIALWAPWRKAPIYVAPLPLRLDVDLGSDVSLEPLVGPTFSTLVISPDGTRLVFVGSVSRATSRLFVRRLDDGTMMELAGTQGATNPFISPDGQWVAFWKDGKIAKVPLEGGAVVPLADLGTMAGGSWADDGDLVVGTGTGLVRIAAGGGSPTPVVNLSSGELFHTFPHVVAGRKAVLFAAVGSPPSIETTNIDIVSLENGRRKTLVRGGASPRYLSSGHLVYASRAGMFAVPFDIDSWETRAPAVPIFGDAIFDPLTGGAQFDVSRDTMVYRKNPGGSASTPMHVQWLDGTGKRVPLLGKPGVYVGPPRVSRDGRVALAIKDGASQDMSVYDPQRDTTTRLTSGGGMFLNPVWSPDGRYVVFGSMGGGIRWARADGAGQPQFLFSNNSLCPSSCFQWPTSVTRDGTRLLFEQVGGKGPQIWSVELSEDERGLKAGTPMPFLKSAYQDGGAAFSPDGRWIAYHSNKSGRFEVYVRPFSTSPGKESEVQISNGGGGRPVWLPKGVELFYQAGEQIMAVRYTTRDGSFLADKSRVWAGNVTGATGFDVAPDGKRLALILPTAARDAPRQDHTVVFVQNILDELRRRAPLH
jgi:Tol biopolymer transport system component